ncbi:MAG TPA: response regulator transcription factor [Bryobacteraceae bacterium]|nr:response regulator transcription factor [Bryobacteraceae bacterium]
MDAPEPADHHCGLVLADDHPDLLRELQILLRSEFNILQAVTDGQALMRAAYERKPRAIITDIEMPGVDGIEACRNLLQQGLCQAALVLTMHNEEQVVRKALQAGIRGYVLKTDATEELIPAVRSVLGGSLYLSRGVAGKVRNAPI